MLVSFASSSSTLLASIQLLGLCQASAPRSMDASHGHLSMGHAVAGHHYQCHTAHCALCGPRCGLSTASALGHTVPGDARSFGSTSTSCATTRDLDAPGARLRADAGRVIWAGIGRLWAALPKLDVGCTAQEVLGGLQATCFEDLNHEQGKPWCMWHQ
jgi:hypothetical protein